MGNAISSLTNSTVISYVVLGLIVAGISWRYIHKDNNANRNTRPRGREALTSQPKKEVNAKKQRVEQFAKSKPTSYAAAAQASETKPAPEPSKSKDEIPDHLFAQRMAKNKQDKFANKTSSDQKNKQKSVKQSKAKKSNGASKQAEASKATDAIDDPKESVPSSGAEAEADTNEDQSPITTPSVTAADATGVSDMLEQPSAAPSVLRLTNTEEKAKQVKKTKTPEPTETKKQRQNRQKKEQEKALREEQEKERKVLENNQRRTAREAEGRAAKDGSAFMAAQKANAWAEKNANGVPQKDAPDAHQPLDTFDNDAESTPKAAPAPPAKINGHENKENVEQNGKKSDWAADIPYSEEEQLKMLAEEEDFTPVTSKKFKRAQKANAGVASSDDGSVNGNAAPVLGAVTNSAPASKPKAAFTNGRPQPQSIPTQSSFTALADEGADLEEEQEQEWDV